MPLGWEGIILYANRRQADSLPCPRDNPGQKEYAKAHLISLEVFRSRGSTRGVYLNSMSNTPYKIQAFAPANKPQFIPAVPDVHTEDAGGFFVTDAGD